MVHHYRLEDGHGDTAFDAEWYLREYPDVARSGLDPAEHYRTIGKRIGRVPSALYVSIEVRHVIPKRARFTANDEVALLVTHASTGRLKPHVLPYMKQLKAAGLSVALTVVVDRPLEMLDEEIAIADLIIVRENAGYDFGAWAHALRLCPAMLGTRLLVLTNDSVIPTADAASFQAMMERVRSTKADIAGLTANHEHGWHVQSYFLAISRTALESYAFRDFIRSIRRIDDKDEVIRAYELAFAEAMRAAGLSIEVLYNGPYPSNPVIWSWRELIEDGFPFIKLLLLRKVMAKYVHDKRLVRELHKTWPAVLEAAGFDTRLVENTIRASEMGWMPPGRSKELLSHPDKFKAYAR